MTDKSFKGVFRAWQNLCDEQESCEICPLHPHCAIGGIEGQTDFEDSDIDFIEEYLDGTGYLYVKH